MKPLDLRSCILCFQLQELVHEELLKIAEAAAPKDLGRFPALQRRLATAVLEYIQVGSTRPHQNWIQHTDTIPVTFVAPSSALHIAQQGTDRVDLDVYVGMLVLCVCCYQGKQNDAKLQTCFCGWQNSPSSS